ncbi:MAG: hypothetical protein AB1861_03820 [Cyanobacteriota bacterium]
MEISIPALRRHRLLDAVVVNCSIGRKRASVAPTVNPSGKRFGAITKCTRSAIAATKNLIISKS